MYSATNNLTPSTIYKYDIRSGGTPTEMYGAPYWGQYEPYGNLWISGDATRLITRGGFVFRDSPIQSQDMTYLGSLSGATAVQAAVQNAGSTRLYVLGGAKLPNPWGPIPVLAPDLRTYETQFLGFVGSVPLPRFKVPSGSGTVSYASDGRFLFENAAGTRVYAIVQAPSGSGITQGWAVANFKVVDLP
jgi:hypothetical protein